MKDYKLYLAKEVKKKKTFFIYVPFAEEVEGFENLTQRWDHRERNTSSLGFIWLPITFYR